MISLRSHAWRLLFTLLCTLVAYLVAWSVPASHGQSESLTAARWQRQLPSTTCPTGDLNCHRASPALADMDGDGILDIVVGTHAGRVLALKDNGTASGRVLWDRDIAPAIGLAPGTAIIQSSPAVADIDADGQPEVVVGYGPSYVAAGQGGVIVLEHDGRVKSGWPRHSLGAYGNPTPMTIFGSPALGDLDNDGDLEIVVGGFDKRLYAYHHHGALLAGFPADSYLAFRFPTWPNLRGALADGIWSSPALADLDGDGFLDILLGTDEGYFDARWGGNAYGWSCPYRLPAGWAPGYCGGSLYALNRFGQVLPGYPRYILETIQSTPAVVDMNLDGRLDVVVGTGAFYHTYSPDRPTHGFRIQAWDRTGNEVPGWSGGKALGGVAPASPGVGDIAGDSRPEIVLGANDGRLHAWHLNGSPVAGFPMRPRSRLGGGTGFDVGLGFILADYDGDGKMEIFVSQNDSITVIDGNGAQLTTSNNGADGRPGYATGGWLVNNPAVGDVNGDGRLDLVAHDSRLYVWTLPAAGSQADWPQFKRDASRASRFRTPGFLAAATDRSAVIKNIIDPTRGGAFGIRNGGDEPLNWSLDRSGAASNVTFSRLSGTISPGESTSVQISASGLNGFGSGFHHLGAVVVNTTTQSGAPAGSDSIELRLLKGNLTELFLPLTRR